MDLRKPCRPEGLVQGLHRRNPNNTWVAPMSRIASPDRKVRKFHFSQTGGARGPEALSSLRSLIWPAMNTHPEPEAGPREGPK